MWKCSRLVRLIALVALACTLAVPAIAPAARSDRDRALAQERHYASYGEPPGAARRATTVTIEDAGAWRPAAIVAGALVLVLGAAELVTLGRLRGSPTA
jgi:hypothetical protein